MWEGRKHQFAGKIIMTSFGKCFCEYIRQLMMSRGMRQCYLLSNNMLTDEVTINFNMLSPFIEDRIVLYSGGTSIVRIERRRSTNKDTQFTKKV